MSRRILREAAAVGLLLAAVLLAVALASHSPLDPSPLHLSSLRDRPANLAGWLGASLSAALVSLIGLSSVLVPVVAGVFGWRLLRERPVAYPRLVAAGWAVLAVVVPAFVHLVQADLLVRGGTVPGGGLVGRAVAELLGGFAGSVGRLVLLVFGLVVGLLLVSGASAAAATERISRALARRFAVRRERKAASRRLKEKETARRRVLERQLERLVGDDEYPGSVTVKELEGRGRFRIVRRSAPEAGPPEPLEVEPQSEPAARPDRPPRKPRQPSARSGAPVVQEEFDFVEDLDRATTCPGSASSTRPRRERRGTPRP